MSKHDKLKSVYQQSLLKIDVISIFASYLAQCKKMSAHYNNQFSCLRSITKNKVIQLVHMDKGTGSVMMTKEDYLSKLNDIIKFEAIIWAGDFKF